MYYFGAYQQAGHYLFDNKMRHTWKQPGEFPVEWKKLDGTFCPTDPKRPQGVVSIWRTQDWAIVAWWDTTCDRRPGSNSAFIVQAEPTDTDLQLVERGVQLFPMIAKRVGKLVLPNGMELKFIE